MKAAVLVYGLAIIATGIIDLVWGSFDPSHQPIQAFGDNVPGRHILAYAAGALLVAGGAAIQRRGSARFGALAVAFVYFIVAIFWLPRFYTAPLVLGVSPNVYVGVLGGVCQQLIVIAAAVVVYVEAAAVPWAGVATATARWIFGLSAIDFGLQHLTSIANNIAYVPLWMPFGQAFWVALTGTAFVLAGIAIVGGVLDALAARLLAIMLLVFSAVTLLPWLVAGPHVEGNWGGNAYNIVAAASAWIVAEWLAARKRIVTAS